MEEDMEEDIEQKHSGRRISFILLSIGLPMILLGLNGCVATRSWVENQLAVLTGRVSNVERRVDETDTKTERALRGLESLQLKSKLVLEVDDGVNFAFDSAGLNESATRKINEFIGNLSNNSFSRVVIAGHTDDIGSEAYNYELGKKRAEAVARYLITRKAIDPTKIAIVSYGESSPIDGNSTPEGRKKNRRVEILVYEESITNTDKN